MWVCPVCGSKVIGKISRGRYFCGDCCHEWTIEEGGIAIYQIAVDGTAVRLRNRLMGKKGIEPLYSKRNVS